jgi:putative ATP-dependent endonuclease of OLD family
MARITRLEISNYRSVEGPVEITFPDGVPLVLFGENNAGKSNVFKALELVLGPFWPGNHDPDDHEFFNRDRSRVIEVVIQSDPTGLFGGRYERLRWKYDRRQDPPVTFLGESPPGRTGWVRGEDRDSSMCVLVTAERNLSYHLGYTSKWTFLSRLMHKFHKSMTDEPEVRERLEALFAEIKAEFRRIPSFLEFVTGLQGEFLRLTSSMTYNLEVDFEAYNPVNFFQALRLQASEGGEPRVLEEMGTGEQQVLALAFAHAFARAFHAGVFLAIEEPESHLHPLAQEYLGSRLHEMARDGLQLMLTTHSPAFLRLEALEGLVQITKGDQGTFARQLSRRDLRNHCVAQGAPRERVLENGILPFYASAATKEILEGFFARGIVLVEGATESLCLPILLARVGFDCARSGIAVIPVHGKGNLGKWFRLFTAYAIPTFIVFDNDGREDDPEGVKRDDALQAVGLAVEQRRIVLEEAAVRVEEWGMVFGRNFEQALRILFPTFADLEAQARAVGTDSKPFVARWAVQRLPGDDADGWIAFQRLRDNLERLIAG